MKKLAGAFLALGVLAAACGDDGGAAISPTPATAGAAGVGAGATNANSGNSGDAGQSTGATMAVGGEGGTPSTGVVQGGAGAGGDPNALAAGGWEEVHGDPPVDPSCGDYAEHRDRFNPKTYDAEQTGLSMDTAPLTICGRIDAYHHTPASDVSEGFVDGDAFRLDYLGPGDYLVAIELLDEQLADRVVLFASASFSGSAESVVSDKRAGVWLHVEDAASGIVLVEAYSAQPMARSVPYKLHILPDNPAGRCPTIKPAGADQTYAEAHDGAGNNGNDVIHYTYPIGPQQPTALATDQPEASAIVLDVGDHSLITGSSALVNYGDDYDDADMFAFKTGTSKVVTLRLDWAGAKTDLDVMLFKEGEYSYVASRAKIALVAPEVLTLMVEPQTKYWLYVVGGSNSLAGGLPLAYGVTLCGEELTLP